MAVIGAKESIKVKISLRKKNVTYFSSSKVSFCISSRNLTLKEYPKNTNFRF